MSYQPIILPADLTNKVYQETINLITRNDPNIAQEAIDAAIGEAKIYLSKYDLVQMFGDQGNNISAVFSDTFLTNLIKDIALWHLFTLANPNISLELARTKYMDAKKMLREIQNGDADPKWPYMNTTGQTAPQGDAIAYSSNRRNHNHF